jgi:EpsI family protein
LAKAGLQLPNCKFGTPERDKIARASIFQFSNLVKKMFLKQAVIASAIMLLTMAGLRIISHTEEIHPNKSFSSFPIQMGDWKGTKQHFPENILDVLGVDDYFLANYKKTNNFWINLYVGFYQSQREGDLIHSPKNCMPGSGWNITHTELEELEISGTPPRKIKVIKLITRKGPYKQITLYWFQSRGRIISSEYMQKIWLVVDSITRHRTDGSFVRLIAPIIGNDEERSLNQLKDFAGQLMPVLNEYIPS